MNGFYNGVKLLVHSSEWKPEPDYAEPADQPKRMMKRDDAGEPLAEVRTDSTIAVEDTVDGATPDTTEQLARVAGILPLKPEIFHPYPNYTSEVYLKSHYPVEECYMDEATKKKTPDIFVYPGVPQGMTLPYFGSYEELDMRGDMCFERFGRFGPYGYGYGAQEGGLGLGTRSEASGSNEIWALQKKVDYKNMDWGKAQRTCYQKNKRRFRPDPSEGDLKRSVNDITPRDEEERATKKLVPRTAFVLRTWTGFEYTAHEILTLRSLINELSLKSGGEYDVHLLLHVRDDSIPIWASKDVYRKVIEENIPREFWGITTLWSVQLMRMYYPGPFTDNFENPSDQDIHGVYRGNHYALQWFGHEHPEYDFVWNWEMDVRYSGHNFDFHNGVAEWAKKQPRRGLWERNGKFYIPSIHGSYENFTSFVDAETIDKGEVPIWGPTAFANNGQVPSPKDTKPPHGYFDDNFEWGVGEEADLITFNPIFDVSKTNWVFRNDITGFSTAMPIPPRRCSIITVSRLSRRLLDLMHEETYVTRHSAFPEMWPPTVALHHGLKAVYIPHPVYFDRKWPLEYMDQIFNYPKTAVNSVFGFGEHNFFGSSFYYNAGFSGALWRRWLGERERDEGGAHEEIAGSGRMCLRPTLHHPVKMENLPTD